MGYDSTESVADELVTTVCNERRLYERANEAIEREGQGWCKARILGVMFPLVDQAAVLYVRDGRPRHPRDLKAVKEMFPENIRELAVSRLYDCLRNEYDLSRGVGDYSDKATDRV